MLYLILIFNSLINLTLSITLFINTKSNISLKYYYVSVGYTIFESSLNNQFTGETVEVGLYTFIDGAARDEARHTCMLQGLLKKL